MKKKKWKDFIQSKRFLTGCVALASVIVIGSLSFDSQVPELPVYIDPLFDSVTMEAESTPLASGGQRHLGQEGYEQTNTKTATKKKTKKKTVKLKTAAKKTQTKTTQSKKVTKETYSYKASGDQMKETIVTLETEVKETTKKKSKKKIVSTTTYTTTKVNTWKKKNTGGGNKTDNNTTPTPTPVSGGGGGSVTPQNPTATPIPTPTPTTAPAQPAESKRTLSDDEFYQRAPLLPEMVKKAFVTLGFKVIIDPGVNYSGYFDAKYRTLTLKTIDDGIGTIYHEMGHFIAFAALSPDRSSAFSSIFNSEKDRFPGQYKTYALQNESEYYAESMREYILRKGTFTSSCPSTAAALQAGIDKITDAQITLLNRVYGSTWAKYSN